MREQEREKEGGREGGKEGRGEGRKGRKEGEEEGREEKEMQSGEYMEKVTLNALREDYSVFFLYVMVVCQT
jgi:hypothetical protein